ncbi:UNVERIFIED_CONTAM: hypothetical protein PYX00_009077 [Menopon gallinae]|uniref:F-box domain-containing protein n=1 Tax=Menopon gallinae TaxID=328185 RepID=A0AAW2H9Y9_9NEOP
MDSNLPAEVILKILSYADGETLRNCERASPLLLSLVELLTERNIWEDCCSREIPGEISFEIISKLYPHDENLANRKNWRLIYDRWYFHNMVLSSKEWEVTVKNISKTYNKIKGVITHGTLILVLLQYDKNFCHYNKIYTINDKNELIDKSSRFIGSSLYISPLNSLHDNDNNKNGDDDSLILLHCKECKLIGIPTYNVREQYPKIKFKEYNPLFMSVKHSNGNKVYFDSDLKLYSISSCRQIKKKNFENLQPFIHISSDSNYKYFICQDVACKICTLDEIRILRSTVTCYRSFGNLILLGTTTGMLYYYNCKNKFDVSNFKLENYSLCLNVSSDPLVMIDVMVSEKEFEIICCDSKNIYRIGLVMKLWDF